MRLASVDPHQPEFATALPEWRAMIRLGFQSAGTVLNLGGQRRSNSYSPRPPPATIKY